MNQNTLTAIIEEQTRRALWEVKNVISCIPDELWNKSYCEMPCWKHVYHMGMLMGFIIDDTGLWPRVLGLENPFPEGEYNKYL